MTNHMFDRERERLETVVQLIDAPSETRLKMIEEYRRRSEAAFAPATLRNYTQITAMFTNWCDERGYDEIGRAHV